MASSLILARRINPIVQRRGAFVVGSRRAATNAAATDTRPSVSPPEKVLETFAEEFEVGPHKTRIETGLLARFANGSAVFSVDETHVLSTVACGKGGDGPAKGFLPLSVEYQEKCYAQGIIPATFMRREGAARERELLCGRLIDRPIRPLFPTGFYHDIQVMVNILASNQMQDPDVMAINATSAALMLSDIPWGGPIGAIRLGRICGDFVINPSMDELSLSDLNLVYACTQDKTLMIDGQAREITERDLSAGLHVAHAEAVRYIEPQIKLAKRAGKCKKEYTLSLFTPRTLDKVSSLTEGPIEDVFTDSTYGKFKRGEALDKITQNVKAVLEEECDEESLKFLPKVVDTVRKKVVRQRIIEKGIRVDGRQLDEVRPLYCKHGKFSALHGSSIFSRGETQVFCTVTLGSPSDAQKLQSLVGPPTKRFMLHYSFPPFSINEIGRRGAPNRREIGHGTLAEKALLAVLPPEDDFPYTIRLNSEVMASDGSTSMASVCGGSMALMDAGIRVREHVAGVSVGLVSNTDPSTGKIRDYRILTDILGLEDHLGDMDFKVAGTNKGVTAIQLDIKPAGIPLDIICESLDHAKSGRIQILNRMQQEISAPRTQDDMSAPRLVTLRYSDASIQRLLGPQRLKKKIEQETGARLSVWNDTLTIIAKDQKIMERVQEMVDFLIGREIEVGGIYKCIVTSIKEFGAFVEFNGGQQALLHISELSHRPVSKVSDAISIGDRLSLMCIGMDVRGNIKLSLKALSPQAGNADQPTSETRATNPPEVLNSVGNSVPESGTDGSERYDFGSSEVLVRSADECDDPEMRREQDANAEKPREQAASSSCINADFSSRRHQSSTNRTGGLLSKMFSILRDKNPSSNHKTKTLEQTPKSSEGDMTKTLDRILVSLEGDRESSYNMLDHAKHKDGSSAARIPGRQKDGSSAARIPSGATVAMKLGDTVTAKVHKVHLHGLVLDLGGGLRGMYKFPVNGKTVYSVGMELRVKCVSFSSKGIPIMTLCKD